MTKEQKAMNDLVAEMTKGIEAVTRAEKENGIIPRFNQSKTIACLKAQFSVHEDIPEDFLSFIRARQKGKVLGFFINPLDMHLQSLWIVLKAQQKHLSPLDIRYWSTVPFRLGENSSLAVKYSVTPCSSYTTTRAVDPGENQLRSAVKMHLKKGEARFHFGVQKQTDPDTMPIEDASVIWDETASPSAIRILPIKRP